MIDLLARLRRRLLHTKNGKSALPAFDLDTELTLIEQAEAGRVIPTGRLIHQFAYQGLDLRLDRDMTGMYRITVNEGGHRLYSFTVVCPHEDYRTLRSGYDEIIRFLSGTRAISELPNHEHVRGHYYGAGAPDVTG
jgi:hypothetical protein